VRHQERRSAWCGVQVGQVKCWCWWRSAECNWGEQSQAKVSQWGLRSACAVQQPSMLSIAERRRMERVSNQFDALLIKAGEGIDVHWLI
jgi:hypothetical protein